MKEIRLKVQGMMCGGCENRVQNALKTIEGVESVKANHKEGTVIVNVSDNLNEDILKEKIEDIGYEVN